MFDAEHRIPTFVWGLLQLPRVSYLNALRVALPGHPLIFLFPPRFVIRLKSSLKVCIFDLCPISCMFLESPSPYLSPHGARYTHSLRR